MLSGTVRFLNSRMRGVAELQKVLVEGERNGLSELCKIGDVIWEWEMVSEGKWDSNFEKDRKSNGESNVWCKTDGEKEDRGPDRDVGIEGNSGSDGKGACAEEGWWACSKKSVGSLKWRARGSEDDQRRRGRSKWRRRARVLVWRKRTQWIERDGEWELERLLLKWGKSGQPRLRGINPDQNWFDDDDENNFHPSN